MSDRIFNVGDLVKLNDSGRRALPGCLCCDDNDALTLKLASTMYRVTDMRAGEDEAQITLSPDLTRHFRYITEHDPWVAESYFEPASALEQLAETVTSD